MLRLDARQFWPWALLCGLLLLSGVHVARADDMDLALSRLGRGDCGATLTGSDRFQLSSGTGLDRVQTLVPDNRAFRQLTTQLSAAVAPAVLAPVTTSGPRGFDVALQTTMTGIDSSADYWKRGSRGRGSLATATCDGRNRFVNAILVSNRLSVDKGLPFGLSFGAELGRLWDTSLWTLGGHLKWALVEGYRKMPLPDLAVRSALNAVVGDSQFSMALLSIDGVLSKNLVVARVMQVAPYLGGGVAITFASSQLVDLTPNIDATLCAEGTDPACATLSPGERGGDIAHDRTFDDLTITRTRGFVGAQVRYGLFAFASEVVFDLVPPRRSDGNAGAHTPRQWTVSFAPSLSY